MHVYKLIFINNEVAGCEILERSVGLTSDHSYQHAKGKLIYALVKAGSKAEAMNMGAEIIAAFTKEQFPEDLVD